MIYILAVIDNFLIFSCSGIYDANHRHWCHRGSLDDWGRRGKVWRSSLTTLFFDIFAHSYQWIWEGSTAQAKNFYYYYFLEKD
jgi:hypothetical protein